MDNAAQPSLREFVSRLQRLRVGLACLARLQALAVLAERRIPAKLKLAGSAYGFGEAAHLVETHLERQFQRKPAPVSWPRGLRLDLAKALRGRRLDRRRLAGIFHRTAAIASGLNQDIAACCRRFPIFEPASTLVKLVGAVLPARAQRAPRDPRAFETRRPRAIRKVLEGPERIGFDGAFRPSFSLLETPGPDFGATARETAPYFWMLAVRESTAAAMCCLCLVEYDGLPLEFYRDMAKQAYDEMRHGHYYLETGVALIPELLARLPASDPLRGLLGGAAASGVKLPVPREWGLYEALHNASLVERLVLLQLRTETPAIRRLQRKLGSVFCRRHPQIRTAIEVDMRDEVSHSLIGHRWLRHLAPDARERRRLAAEVDLLRAVLILIPFSDQSHGRHVALLREYSGGRIAPGSPGWQPAMN